MFKGFVGFGTDPTNSVGTGKNSKGKTRTRVLVLSLAVRHFIGSDLVVRLASVGLMLGDKSFTRIPGDFSKKRAGVSKLRRLHQEKRILGSVRS